MFSKKVKHRKGSSNKIGNYESINLKMNTLKIWDSPGHLHSLKYKVLIHVNGEKRTLYERILADTTLKKVIKVNVISKGTNQNCALPDRL